MVRPHWTTFARGVKKERGIPNKTECAFLVEYIQPMLDSGEAVHCWYEAWSFKLTETTPEGKPGIRYTPDFVVFFDSGNIDIYEVKGYATNEALNRVKMFADKYPFKIFVATKQTKKNGGKFLIEEY